MACETNKSTMQLVAGHASHASRPHYIYIYLLMYAMCRRYNPWFVDQNAAAPVAQKSVCGMQHLQWYLPWKFAVCRQWAVDYLRISLHRSRFTTKCLQAAFCELIDTQTYTTHWYISMSFNRLARYVFLLLNFCHNGKLRCRDERPTAVLRVCNFISTLRNDRQRRRQLALVKVKTVFLHLALNERPCDWA